MNRDSPLSRLWRNEVVSAWCLLAPALLGFVVFFALPALRAVAFSLTDWNLLRPPRFIGVANYVALAHDARFWRGLKLAGIYALFNIPLQTVLGLFLAVAMHRLTRSVFVRGVVLLPYMLSNVLVALIWLWMLDPLLGVVNHLMELAGAARQPFLAGSGQALATLAAMNTWRFTGMTAMLFLAGLQHIPGNLYEAAALEGASELQMFRRITLPLLRPVMAYVLVSSVTGSIQLFDSIAVTTEGGPAGATDVIVYYIVQNAFGYLKMGYASAMSLVLCALLVVYSLIQMRMMHADASDLA